MANQTTPLQNLTYIETVLEDLQAVLKKMYEDQDIPSEQREKLSACLNEIYFALKTIQDDGIGLHSKIEWLMSIEQQVEPPVTNAWTRFRGSLQQCLEKAAETYYYTTQEDQGTIDWRVWTTSLQQRDQDVFTPSELLERIAADQDQAGLPAILDYDSAFFGESLSRDDQVEPLWIHAKLYIVGHNIPVAWIYRIDLGDQELSEEEQTESEG
jgi:hypothetical protein